MSRDQSSKDQFASVPAVRHRPRPDRARGNVRCRVERRERGTRAQPAPRAISGRTAVADADSDPTAPVHMDPFGADSRLQFDSWRPAPQGRARTSVAGASAHMRRCRPGGLEDDHAARADPYSRPTKCQADRQRDRWALRAPCLVPAHPSKHPGRTRVTRSPAGPLGTSDLSWAGRARLDTRAWQPVGGMGVPAAARAAARARAGGRSSEDIATLGIVQLQRDMRASRSPGAQQATGTTDAAGRKCGCAAAGPTSQAVPANLRRRLTHMLFGYETEMPGPPGSGHCWTNEKGASDRSEAPSKRSPAVSYSPTGSPLQYHRR